MEHMNDEEMIDMTIAIHNPASIDVIGAQIAVPDKNFEVYLFDEKTGKFI